MERGERMEAENRHTGESCTAYTYQSAAISVPVTVRPRVKTGEISTFCCGEPRISPSPFRVICSPDTGNCSFLLTQQVCIEIPIEISADALTCCPYIKCGEAGKECREACGG